MRPPMKAAAATSTNSVSILPPLPLPQENLQGLEPLFHIFELKSDSINGLIPALDVLYIDSEVRDLIFHSAPEHSSHGQHQSEQGDEEPVG